MESSEKNISELSNQDPIMFEQRKISKYYNFKEKKFINPSYITKTIHTRDIETWPSHCRGHIRPTRQIMVSNAHRVKVQEEHLTKLPSLVPKAKFLNFLENHIQTELNHYKANEVQPTPIRLQIYEEAFEWLSQALKSYRPILAAVKREYQMNIDHLKAELRQVEPMKELLWTLSHEYDAQVKELRNQDMNGINDLNLEMKKYSQTISDLKSEKETLRFQVARLKEELENEANIANSERDARKLLIGTIDEMTIKLNELEKLTWNTEELVQDDPVKLRWAYEAAKKSLYEANKQVLELQISYNDVVPKSLYDEAVKEINQVKMELFNINKEKQKIMADKRIIQQKFDVNCVLRDFLYSQLKITRKKLIGTLPYTKSDKSTIERSENRVHKENLTDGIDKWQSLAAEMTHSDLLQLINTELQKTDGSAEVLIEVLSASLPLCSASVGASSSFSTENEIIT